MNDQELRALVREAIAKQLGGWRDPLGSAALSACAPLGPAHESHHPSHGVYLIAREDDSGPCLIEPSVPCTHCNYCKSHGH